MAESTLSLTYTELVRRVGYDMGYGRDSAAFTAAQTSEVDDVLIEGMRQFYSPPAVGGRPSHEWSFLRPRAQIIVWGTVAGTVSGVPSYAAPVSTVTATVAKFHPSMVGQDFTFDTSGVSYEVAGYTSTTVITLVGNASGEASGDTFTITAIGDYRLPDDFGTLLGDITISSTSFYTPLRSVGEGKIRAERKTANTGTPTNYSVIPRTTDGTGGQRWDLMLYPVPDAQYTLDYTYRINPQKLTSTIIYPYGGERHSATIVASCMAAVELSILGAAGPKYADFLRKLETSILEDARTAEGTTIGSIYERSRNYGVDRNPFTTSPTVTHG